jgi:uncharacterized membrane protein (DUF373 family)
MLTAGNRNANTSQQSYCPHALPIAVFSNGHLLYTSLPSPIKLSNARKIWENILEVLLAYELYENWELCIQKPNRGFLLLVRLALRT